MMCSGVILCLWNSPAAAAWNTGFYLSTSVSAEQSGWPGNPVDYRIWRLMQECVYIVQDTCQRHQRLDARKVTKCQSWSVEKGVVCMREGKKTSLCTPAKLKGCVVLFTGWFHRCIRLEHSDASLMHRWNQPVNKTTHPNQQFPEPTHYTTGCYRGKHVVSRHFHRSYLKAKYVKVKS